MTTNVCKFLIDVTFPSTFFCYSWKIFKFTYLLTYLPHGAESFLRS